MESKIKFNVNEHLEPVITVELVQSEDVRDTLAKAFFERLKEGDILKVKYVGDIPGERTTNRGSKTLITIEPVEKLLLDDLINPKHS